MDFDDLKVLAFELLQKTPAIWQFYKERFKAILVDEYRDTNRIQSKILELLADDTNLTVVGDDSQSIYGFRAATVENILNFEKDFCAHRITVGTNYRSTPEIVELANQSILNNRRQIPKTIRVKKTTGDKSILHIARDPNQEARYVLSEIKKQIQLGVSREKISVLFRATRQAAPLQIELQRGGIPFILVGGEDFFSLEYIKVVLDLVRLMLNPDDSISLSGVQNLIGFSSSYIIENFE